MSRARRPAVLCIGGLDPSGGAGLLADAEAVLAAGGRPLAALTAITVQSHRGVARIVPVSPALIVAQVERLLEDEAPVAFKLGMLGRAAVARALTRCLSRRLGSRPLVVDPVLLSTSGTPLFRGEPRRDYAPLFALARVVTPNLLEAERFLGERFGETRPDRERQARRLSAELQSALVLKGGHLAGSADDLVVDGRQAAWIPGARLDRSRRGTGCRFASFLATRLARGDGLIAASRAAKTYVRGYLAAEA